MKSSILSFPFDRIVARVSAFSATASAIIMHSMQYSLARTAVDINGVRYNDLSIEKNYNNAIALKYPRTVINIRISIQNIHCIFTEHPYHRVTRR